MKQAEAVVAGHICLDIILTFPRRAGDDIKSLLAPGTLMKIGPAVFSTGGAVSNTGLALHVLGVRTRLLGKVGDDVAGRAILDLVGSCAPGLGRGMIVAKGGHSSYTVVINRPGLDRMFLHCPGANDSFGADDIDYQQLRGARLFHFGYPPLMQRVYCDGGSQMETIFRRARELGLTTSLDMSMPDRASEAGRVDWRAYLQRVLPFVDLFLPSFDETLLMVEGERFDRGTAVDGALLGELARRLLDWGAKIVVFKLGDQGAYMRTADDARRLADAGACAPKDPSAWAGRELLVPCFLVDVVGTTGSGDSTIAGFLAGLLHGLGPQEALIAAVAAGACNVEGADAISGMRPWAQMQRRISAGWDRRAVSIPLPDWSWDGHGQVWTGPGDTMDR